MKERLMEPPFANVFIGSREQDQELGIRPVKAPRHFTPKKGAISRRSA
jgi:hypothetical protein